MNYNNIIIVLLVVIFAILLLGMFLFGPFAAREDVSLNVTTQSVLYDGDNFGVVLLSGDGSPISNASLDVVIADANGGENHQVITTDDTGNAFFTLKGLAAGNYVVNVTYNGNARFNSIAISQNIEIREANAVAPSTSQDTSESLPYDINNLPPSNDPYPETNRFYIDQYHVRQEYEDNYFSIVDLRTGDRHGGFY